MLNNHVPVDRLREIVPFPAHEGKRAKRFDIVFEQGSTEWSIRLPAAETRQMVIKLLAAVGPIDGYDR